MRRAGSLWHKTAGVATPRNNPPHRSGPVCLNPRDELKHAICHPNLGGFQQLQLTGTSEAKDDGRVLLVGGVENHELLPSRRGGEPLREHLCWDLTQVLLCPWDGCRLVHLDVEDCSEELLVPAVLFHK